jgi:hypothetical protein
MPSTRRFPGVDFMVSDRKLNSVIIAAARRSGTIIWNGFVRRFPIQ